MKTETQGLLSLVALLGVCATLVVALEPNTEAKLKESTCKLTWFNLAITKPNHNDPVLIKYNGEIQNVMYVWTDGDLMAIPPSDTQNSFIFTRTLWAYLPKEK